MIAMMIFRVLLILLIALIAYYFMWKKVIKPLMDNSSTTKEGEIDGSTTKED